MDMPKQRCKHCGREITGEVAVSAGGGFVKEGGMLPKPYPLGYRFECSGPHEREDQDRVWYWTVPDPVKDAQD